MNYQLLSNEALGGKKVGEPIDKRCTTKVLWKHYFSVAQMTSSHQVMGGSDQGPQEEECVSAASVATSKRIVHCHGLTPDQNTSNGSYLLLHETDGVLRVPLLGLLSLRDGAGANLPQGLLGLVAELFGQLGQVLPVLPRHSGKTHTAPSRQGQRGHKKKENDARILKKRQNYCSLQMFTISVACVSCYHCNISSDRMVVT